MQPLFKIMHVITRGVPCLYEVIVELYHSCYHIPQYIYAQLCINCLLNKAR